MTAITEAIAHTPVFVWPLIAVVLFLGARNLWPRERPLSRMFILPAVLLVFAVFNLTASRADLTLPIAASVASFAIGIGVGWNLVPNNVMAMRERGAVLVPGSITPLLVVIAIVILRYAVGYIYGRWPELRGDAALSLELSATGALLAGIVWGRVLHFAGIYRRAA